MTDEAKSNPNRLDPHTRKFVANNLWSTTKFVKGRLEQQYGCSSEAISDGAFAALGSTEHRDPVDPAVFESCFDAETGVGRFALITMANSARALLDDYYASHPEQKEADDAATK